MKQERVVAAAEGEENCLAIRKRGREKKGRGMQTFSCFLVFLSHENNGVLSDRSAIFTHLFLRITLYLSKHLSNIKRGRELERKREKERIGKSALCYCDRGMTTIAE